MVKGKMKKFILWILAGLIVLVLVGVLIFSLYGNQLIRKAIIAGAEKALQVDVRLESVDLKLLAGKTELKNLEIDNPQGYEHPTFLKLGRTYVELDTSSVLSDTVEIPLMQLEDIAVVIEQKGKTSNLSEILDNLPQPETEEKTEPEPAKSPEESAGKNVRIAVLEINNVEVKAKMLPIPGRADTVTLRIKPIRMENIGSGEKVDLPALTAEIIKAISKGVAEQGADLLPTDMISSLSKQLGKQGEALIKESAEVSEDVIKSGADIGKKTTETVTEGIGGLFKKKEKE